MFHIGLIVDVPEELGTNRSENLKSIIYAVGKVQSLKFLKLNYFRSFGSEPFSALQGNYLAFTCVLPL